VTRLRYQALVITAVLAGVGGSYLSIAQGANFVNNMSNGRGYIALAALIFAIISGESAGFTAASVLALFAVSLVAGTAFVWWERRAPFPLLNLGYLRVPWFTIPNVVAYCTYFATFAIFFFTALYLGVIAGYGAYRIAGLFLPMTVMMIVASLLAGRLTTAVGARWLLVAGSVFFAPSIQARQCSGNGDLVGSFGFSASRSGFFLLGAAAGTGSGSLPVIPVTPPGTTGATAVTQTAFVGSNTGIGKLLTGLANPNVFSSVGRVFADGLGNLYASPTAGLPTNILVGTYNITTSCSITMTLTDPFVTTTSGSVTTPTTPTPITLTGYITGNATQLVMYGTNGAVNGIHIPALMHELQSG